MALVWLNKNGRKRSVNDFMCGLLTDKINWKAVKDILLMASSGVECEKPIEQDHLLQIES